MCEAINTYHLLNFKGVKTSTGLWLVMVLILLFCIEDVFILESRSDLSRVSLDGASWTRQNIVDD